MKETQGIQIEKKRLDMMLQKIVFLEKQNQRDKAYSEQEMIDKIRAIIEEEATCR